MAGTATMNILCTKRQKNPNSKKSSLFAAVLWLCIDFNADPVPDQNSVSQKSDFYMKNIQVIRKKHTVTTVRRYKTLMERQETRLLVHFGQLPCSRVRIRIPKKDPDQRQPNQCGSGSTALVCRYKNTLEN